MMSFAREEMYIQIYGYESLVVVTDNIIEYVNKEIGDIPVDIHHIVYQNNMALILDYRHTSDRDYDFVIMFNLRDLSGRTLNHETFHLTARIMRYVGVTLVPESEEAFCYLSDYIFHGLEKKTTKLRKELIAQMRKEEKDGNPNRRKEVPKTT